MDFCNKLFKNIFTIFSLVAFEMCKEEIILTEEEHLLLIGIYSLSELMKELKNISSSSNILLQNITFKLFISNVIVISQLTDIRFSNIKKELIKLNGLIQNEYKFKKSE